MKWIGKKGWIPSGIFWIAYILIGAIVAGLFTTMLPEFFYAGAIAQILVFMGLAHYWYKFKWEQAFKLLIVAWIIDIIIVIVIVGIILAFFGIALAGIWSSLVPGAVLV